VLLFADRCEFISPGKLPNTVTVEKLGRRVDFAETGEEFQVTLWLPPAGTN